MFIAKFINKNFCRLLFVGPSKSFASFDRFWMVICKRIRKSRKMIFYESVLYDKWENVYWIKMFKILLFYDFGKCRFGWPQIKFFITVCFFWWSAKREGFRCQMLKGPKWEYFAAGEASFRVFFLDFWASCCEHILVFCSWSLAHCTLP